MLEYLKICRIDHWLKNIFIVFGHVVALVLILHLEVTAGFIGKAVLSLIPACFIASAYYILNEILDAPFDALHPTKKLRGIPAGKVKVPVLWVIMMGLLLVGFVMAFFLFPNPRYVLCLAILFICALLYNVPPIRLKDKAFLDVISESINNPLRLWLGWFAVVPADFSAWPPVSIVLAWWGFGALLMTGKRYCEYRFIGCKDLSGMYRKSFKVYNEHRLILAMIIYACIFCFAAGLAMATYPELNNIVLVFPMILLAIGAYFRMAMKESSARLEPEQLMKNPWILLTGALTAIGAVGLLFAHKTGAFRIKDDTGLLGPTWEQIVENEGLGLPSVFEDEEGK